MAPSVFLVTTAPGFEKDARHELQRAVPGGEAENLLLRGNVRLHSPLTREETLAILRDARTQCVAHIVPVDGFARVGREASSLDALRAALPWGDLLRKGQTFVVRCRRRGAHEWCSLDAERSLGLFLEETTGAEAQFEGQPDREVAVEVFQNLAYLGVFEPAARLRKALRRKRKYPPGGRPLNRAELKLCEALVAFGVGPQAAWRVLDLGAAPGGWTKVLAEKGATVIAVDPAELAPAVARLPSVLHIRGRVEAIDLDAIGPVDLIVNDMNLEGVESAGLMCAAARLLRAEAPALMTVKFYSANWRRELKQARQRLDACYEVIRAKRMPHNRSETTLLLRRRPCPSSP